jgi:hypothetical protein
MVKILKDKHFGVLETLLSESVKELPHEVTKKEIAIQKV